MGNHPTNLRENFEALKKIHDSTNHAITQHVATINSLQELLNQKMGENTTLRQQLSRQEVIIQQEIQRLNAEKIEQANEIQRLRSKLKEFIDGPID